MVERVHPLLQVSLDLTASLTAEDRYRRVLSAVRELIASDVVVLTRRARREPLSDDDTRSPDEGAGRPQAGAGPEQAPERLEVLAQLGLEGSLDRRIPATEGPHGRLLSGSGHLLLKEGDPELEPLQAWAGEQGMRLRAWLGCPLRIEGDMVGTLAMASCRVDAFDNVSDMTLDAISALTAAALRTAGLLDSLEQERDTLQEHLSLEALVLDISTRFIHLPAREIDAGIEEALRRVGEFADVDRCYIFVSDGMLQGGTIAPDAFLRSLHEWCAAGIETSHDAMARVVRSEENRRRHVAARDWLLQRVFRREVIRVDDVSTLPADAPIRFRWEHQGCRSVLVIPLEFGDRAIGIVGFDAVRQARRWDDQHITLLRTIGHILAGAIERKRSAEALRQAHEELERKVHERTRELREKQGQLVQSEKMAALGQLVAGIAHEVNTPLGAISSNNDTLVRALQQLHKALTDSPEKSERWVQLVELGLRLTDVNREAIARIMRIVSSMRNFARLDQAELEQFDVRVGIDSTLTLVNHMLKGRIEVERRFQDVPPIACHANQINQVFMNLLVNAAQAIAERGRIEIDVSAAGDAVRVQVRDDGIGIAAVDLPHIFDPGFTTKGVGIGTGLGLSIVHQIVEEHHGHIDVVSEPGSGTTVTLTLPVHHPHA